MAEWIKPPIGVSPHWFVYRQRIEDLNKAIARYLEHIEKKQHTKELKQEYEAIAEWAKEIQHLALLEAALFGTPQKKRGEGGMKRFYCNGKKGYCGRGNDYNIDCKDCEFANGTGGNVVDAPDTVYEKIKCMSIEELANWLYTNCEWLSAEYGACSGANDYLHLLEFLNSDGKY